MKKRKAIVYIRISHQSQSYKRQEEDLKNLAVRPDIDEVEVIKEIASGMIPFREREIGRIFEDPDVTLMIVQNFDRIGRDSLDVQSTIRELSERGINVRIRDMGMDTLLDDGRTNPVAKIMVNILSTMAEVERDNMLERQAAGIRVAQEKGKFKGRKKGTGETPKKFLAKYPDVIKWLKMGTPVRAIIEITGRKHSTVSKVSRVWREQNGIKKGKKIEPTEDVVNS